MRSTRTRELAERALARLLAHVGPHLEELTVVGGLNPPLLAPMPEAPHQGTVDIDVALDVAPVYDREDQDFGWLERALALAGFTRTAGSEWRWSTWEEGVEIHLDVLCDVLDNDDQEIALPGTRTVTAMNLTGPAAAVRDAQRRPVMVRLGGLDEMQVEVRYAGLGGYLLAKAAACVGRSAPKDHYDLLFVVLHNPGGPVGAARAARNALPPVTGDALAADFRAALGRLTDVGAPSLVAYAAQRQRDGLDDDDLDIRLDAATAARRCLAEFDHGAPAP